MTSSIKQGTREIYVRARMDAKAFAFSCLTAFIAFCLFSTAAWAQSWTLTVHWLGAGTGTVAVSAVALVEASPFVPGASTGSDGNTYTRTCKDGDVVQLTATAAGASRFQGFDGGVLGPTDILMTGDTTVTVRFGAVLSLTVQWVGTGKGTVAAGSAGISPVSDFVGGSSSGSGAEGTAVEYVCLEGDVIRLAAGDSFIPNPATPGSLFRGWNGDEDGGDTIEVIMDAVKRVTVNFRATYTLELRKAGNGAGRADVTAGKGSHPDLAGGPAPGVYLYVDEDVVSLAAIDNEPDAEATGSEFENWTVESGDPGAGFAPESKNASLRVSGNLIVTGRFKGKYLITSLARAGGTITPLGETIKGHGESQSFDVAAGGGYATSDVVIDGLSQGALSSYTFSDINANHEIAAVFVPEHDLVEPGTAGGEQLYQTSVPPMVLLVMGRDHKLYHEAYNDASDINGDGSLDVGYNPGIDYYGYFDSGKVYKYDGANGRFYPVRYTKDKKVTPGAGEWSGDFLNYLTMSRIDVLRRVLYGGYRSTDTAAETVLERAYIPNDGHCWGKEYKDKVTDGYLISEYTPYGEPAAGTRHLFASGSLVAPGHLNYAPLLRVRLNSTLRIWTWVSADNQDGILGDTVVGTPIEDFKVRVLAGVSGLPDLKREKKYMHSGTSSAVWKPIGLLQRFGEPGRMLFGLMSGSYGNHLSGGVLRKNIGPITDEIDLNTGRFKYKYDSSVEGIIKAIDNFRVIGFNHRDSGGDGRWDQTIYSRPIKEGENHMWGNPIAEMMYEGLRYFAGKDPTPEFSTRVSDGNDRGLDLPLEAWEDPFESNPYCSKPFMLVISDINPSYDTDQLPGSAFGTFTGTFGTMNVQALANEIFTEEGLGGYHYIGESGGFYDTACSPKNVTGFGDIRGLCPEEPTKMGGYYAAAVAYYGRTNNVGSNPKAEQKVLTYTVALASPLPRIEIPMTGGKITLVPFAKTVESSSGGGVSPARGSFQPTSAIVDFYVEEITGTYGKFRVVYEHAEQGADFDMDAIITYAYNKTSESTIEVTLSSENVSDGTTRQHFGYIVSGTTLDGVYLEIKNTAETDTGDPDYYLDTPGNCRPNAGQEDLCWNNGEPLPNTKTRAFTVSTGASAATLLRDPLWYAAKWGGFHDQNNNNKPDLKSEWDTNDDGLPDTYFHVVNPLRLEQQLDRAFSDILTRGASHVAPVISVDEANRTQSGDKLYMALFKPVSDDHWQGNLKKYGLAYIPREDCGRDSPEWTVVDKEGQIAGECDGPFKSASRSYWSTEPDGGIVDRGGAGEKLLAAIRSTTGDWWSFRNIYTYLGAGGGAMAPFNKDHITNEHLTSPSQGVPVTDQIRYRIINFVYGYTYDATADGDPVEKRAWILGGIIHSEPKLIDYLNADGTLKKRYIAVGANDGMLHVFDDATGEEAFAFIPPDLLPRLQEFSGPSSHRYMVDGPVQIFTAGSGKTLVFGQRRGGRSYWALDITDPNPLNWKVKWSITGGTGAGSTPGFEELGQSWSRPTPARLRTGPKTVNNVFIFAGGYDIQEDGFPEVFNDLNRNGKWDMGEPHAVTAGGTEGYDYYNPDKNRHGRGLFVVDADDGGILFKATYGVSDVTTGAVQKYRDMKFCFPADVSVIPLSVDEILMYAADIYGNIWKVNYSYVAEPETVAYDSINSKRWKVKRIFASNPGSSMASGVPGAFPSALNPSSAGRKTFYSPDVSLFGNEWTLKPVLYFGTGDREHPRSTAVSNRFYVVADDDRFIDETDLLNLSCNELDADSYLEDAVKLELKDLLHNGEAFGFYRVLDKQGSCADADDGIDHRGQQVLSRPMVFSKNVYFTTYQPTFEDPCDPLGNAFLYALDYSFGTSTFNFNPDNDPAGAQHRNLTDSYRMIQGTSIPSGIRVITREGQAAGLVSVGGTLSGAGEEGSTTIPGEFGGITPILWWTD